MFGTVVMCEPDRTAMRPRMLYAAPQGTPGDARPRYATRWLNKDQCGVRRRDGGVFEDVRMPRGRFEVRGGSCCWLRAG